MPQNEILIALCFLVLGLSVVFGGWSMGFGAWSDPGTGFMPILAGASLSLLSGIWLIIVLVKKPEFSRKKLFEEKESLKKVLLTLLPLACYALFLNSLGFIICTFLFLVFLLKAIEPSPWLSSVRMALIVSFLCFLVFQMWLQVQFPEGLIKVYQIKKWIF